LAYHEAADPDLKGAAGGDLCAAADPGGSPFVSGYFTITSGMNDE
jgi:hypothetical protein